MTLAHAALLLLECIRAATTLSGQVTDPQGHAVAGAHVFVEPGIGGELLHTVANDSGHYTMPGVAPGPAGVFAYAPGFAYGGRHVNVAEGSPSEAVPIRLREAGTLPLHIVNHEGQGVEGARITRIALLDGDKVAIPLAKLVAFGIAEPVSGPGGSATVPHVPHRGRVALKIGHPSYAQEGVAEATADARPFEVRLHPGLLLQGEVLSLSQQAPVSGASVVIQSAQPPHDSSLARTDGQGLFALRLKPGIYMARAVSAAGSSPGWQQVVLTGENPSPRMRLLVAGTGEIRGEIRDAKSGDPIEGARIALESHGNRAAVVRTGPTGTFSFNAASGPNTVRFEAAPGYQPPPALAYDVNVTEGETFELPGMWLAPSPPFRIQVVDEDGAPQPGAVVSLLRPYQFGYRVADESGWVTFDVSVLPESGQIAGLAEDRAGRRGGLFTVGMAEAEGTVVQVYPLAEVTGRTVNRRGRAAGGVQVGALFADEHVEAVLPLWRTVSGPDGTFRWPAVVPGVPQKCFASGAADDDDHAAFNLPPGGAKALGDFRAEPKPDAKSLLGKAFPWGDYVSLCAEGPRRPEGKPVLVVYSPAHAAAMVRQGLEGAAPLLEERGYTPVMITAPEQACENPAIPVLGGAAPGTATTYVLDSEGIVQAECLGLPPLALLRGTDS